MGILGGSGRRLMSTVGQKKTTNNRIVKGAT
jgi:hypothetical protein